MTDENAPTQVTRVNFGPAIVPVPQAVTESRKRNLFFALTRSPSCYAFAQHRIGIRLTASNIFLTLSPDNKKHVMESERNRRRH
jgi:hypothetical protein